MKHKLEIMVVEDNEDDFYLLEDIIAASDELEANLIHATRLADAILLSSDSKIDLAILDLHLPDSVGLDTFDTFHRESPEVPVIILSGARDRDMAFGAVQKGAQDYLYKGDPSPTAIVRTIRFAIERHRLKADLQEALENVKQLQGLLPICSFCKKIRNDEGYWDQIESYISNHAEVQFSHGLCPECGKKHYGKYYSDEA